VAKAFAAASSIPVLRGPVDVAILPKEKGKEKEMRLI